MRCTTRQYRDLLCAIPFGYFPRPTIPEMRHVKKYFKLETIEIVLYHTP